MKQKMTKTKCLLLCILLLIGTIPFNILYAEEEKDTTPYVQYNFNNNLTDAKGHSTLTAWSSTGDNNRSNATTSFGEDADNGTYWQWHSNTARGGGFYIDIDKDIGEEYTIGLKFSFENTLGGWRKIIDYKNSTVDTGFYFYNGGHLNFYNYGVNGASVTQPNQVVDLIVRRNKSGTFEAYIVDGVNKKFDMSVQDSSGQGVPTVIGGKTRLGFFFDDVATNAEASPGGKVYNLKIWDKYMDPDDVIEALLPNGTVNIHYTDEDGDEVLPDEKVSGKSGKPYSVAHKEVFGYQYLRAEGAPTSGTFPDSDEVDVTFRYKCLIPYTVTARYVDEDGNQLCEDIVGKGAEGKTYKANQLEIEDYDFVRVEGNVSGTYTKKPQLVTFIYKPEEKLPVDENSMVTAVYQDEDGNQINPDMIYKGYVGEAYQTSQLYIPGYTFKEIIGSAAGNYTEDPIVVTYVYTKKAEDDPDSDKGGSVIIRYQDNQGYTISSDVLCNGNIGAAYVAPLKDIAKYKFDKVIGEESGVIEDGVKVVTVLYIPLASDVLARYLDTAGRTVAETKVYSGGVGQSYRTEKLDIEGYEFIRVEGNETGTFSEDVQVVKYIYRQRGSITVKYVDLDGKPIKDEASFTDYVDEAYDVTAPYISGYEHIRTEGDATGTFQPGNQVITHVYEKINEGRVIVHFVDDEGKPVRDDLLIHGRVGAPYEVEVQQFHGYEYVRTEGELQGTLSMETAEVTHYYKLTMPDTVTARYVDEDGNLLCDDIIYKGKNGSSYKTSQIEIAGYEFVKVTGSEQGRFQREPQLVTYVYRKAAEKPVPEKGQITASYVDETGNTLHSNLVYQGVLGESCQTSALTIPGYQLKEIVGSESLIYKKENQTVTYIYVPEDPDTPENPERGGTVIVRYQTEEGLTIRHDDVFNGDIGDAYKAVRYQISGYQFIRSEGPFYDAARAAAGSAEEGEIEERVKTVIMYYVPEDKASTVIAKYVDEDGNTIQFDSIYNGFVGQVYQTSQKNISGYKFLRVEGSESGTFSEDVQIVTYVYKRSPNVVMTGRVVIRFVDEDGNIIREEDTYIGYIGDKYQLQQYEISGYKYVRAEGESQGVFTAEDQEIVLVYQKLKEDIDKPGDNKPGQDKPGDSKPNQKPGGSSGNSGGTGNQSGTNKNQKNDNLHQMNWQEGRPNTGDQTALHFYIDLLIVSMIGLVAIVRKLKIDKKK
ncbi:MucBP domain-containing protein [Emergencia sp. JLR.KK010]|uniref:MucBP domain-containing protein n=1 Tax=Emergencia sp. JLR.KK010 TaxID=3114296 RepID=UPI0030CFF152